MRVKINFRKMDPKRMEGRQVILQVEHVDVELGEILCTLIAVSGDIKDGAIDVTPIKAEWGPVKPASQPMDPDLQQLIEAALQFNASLRR